MYGKARSLMEGTFKESYMELAMTLDQIFQEPLDNINSMK